MTKKIITTFLCIILIFSLFPIGIISNAASDDFTISITADNTVYNRGDTITYTVKIKQTGTLTAYGFNLNVPDSLTYIGNTTNSGARSKLGFTGQGEDSGISVQEVNGTKYYLFSGFGANPYKGTDEITLGTIQFKVKDNAPYENVVLDVLHDDDLAANNEEYGDKTISIKKSTVSVEKKKVSSTGVTVSPANKSIVVGKTVQLTATLVPSDSTDSLSWKSEKESVAKVDKNGLVTGVGIGNAKIVVTTTSGKTAEANITITCNHPKTTKHEAIASTCTTHGHSEYYTCDVCGAVTSGTNKELPLADHNYGEWHEEVPAKHENKKSLPGTKGYYKCSVCGQYFDKNHNKITDLTIPAEEHKAEGDYKFDTEKHWKECACGILMQEEAHKPAEAVKENEIPATCTKDGSHDDVVYCSVCGYEISRTKVTDKALGHTGGTATCSKKAVCTRCGEEYGELDSNNHTNIEIKNAKESTLTEEGYTGDKYCKDCGKLVEKGTKIDKFVYEMLDGINGEHTEKTTDSLTFKSNGKLENLVSVFVDETKLTENVDYTAESGSTIITLNSGYLNKLAVGDHTLTMNYNDGGKVSTNFKIAEIKNENTITNKNTNEVTTNKKSVTPKTSDESNMTLWVIGTVLSGICLLGIVKWNTSKRVRRTSKHSK